MDNGKELKREGMERVEQHANPAWMAAATECAMLIALDGAEFTSDDVRDLMRVRHPHVSTRDERAMGPVFSALAKGGFIEKAPRLPINSRRATLHCSPRTVWRLFAPFH